ncbi:hypothetical protein M9H77_24657 [Catharanthus roseus]|uniref:Uncharacterized protein n=1 Tax=Catharanthus roseus TaxID=4058 RepID=A0ACC0AWR8_CATRO|nr:hypothetical protein M9H77_24657 [Catharanthus roseus]
MASDGRMEEQKKRTLDALERRFAQAEAEVRIKKQKGKKRPREEKDRINGGVSYPPADAPVTPSSSISKKKGNISFSGYASKEETEANHVAYCQLSHSVDENLLGDGAEISNRRSAVDHILHELFRQGDSAKKYVQGSKNMKIDIRIPLDTFVPKSGVSTIAQFRQAHSKRSKKHMSLKQQKKCGSFHLPQELHNFELFKPMHEMWKRYTMQLLKTVGNNQLAQCFLNADLHGALILGCNTHYFYCCGFP